MMNIITLTTDVTSLLAGNTYLVESDLDYGGQAITCESDVTILVKKGSINNSTITGAETTLIINTEHIAFYNVVFNGDFRQGGEITVFSTSLLENYSLPIGFTVKTLFFDKQGDKGGSDFLRIPFSTLDHGLMLYPFDPKDTITPVWIFSEKDKYYAETLGIIAEDISKIDSNARLIERYGGRSFTIKLGYGTYYIRNVNLDECKSWTGETSSYYTLNIEGSNDEQSGGVRRSYISTNWDNFVFTVNRPHFRASLKSIHLLTISGSANRFTEQNRFHARQGYGFTRFDKHPSIDGAKPHTTAELSIYTYDVLFWGFRAAFWSGQWSTGCTVLKTSFSGCRWGFYSHLSSNRSLFEDIKIHQCAFGLTTGGDGCVIRRVEITPENWYRDQEAIDTPFFYGYRSNGGFHSAVIEGVYLEDYMADTSTRARYIVYSLAASSSIVFKNCSLQSVNLDSSAYHLEIFKPAGYVPEGLPKDKLIADFREGSIFPTKVKTEEDWMLFGIGFNGSFGYRRQSYVSGGETKVFEFFSGRNNLNFWKGTPSILYSPALQNYVLKFRNTDHKYYRAITSNNSVPVNFARDLYSESSGSFVKTHETLYFKLKLKAEGTCLVNRPFKLKVAELEFLITPVEKTKGQFTFDFSYFAELTSLEFYKGNPKNFYISFKNEDINGGILYNSLGKMITVTNLEFDLYE